MCSVYLSCAPERDGDLALELKRALEAAGIRVVDPATGDPDRDAASGVSAAIHRCDGVIALAGRDRPNVLIDLGYVMGAGKDVLVVSDSVDAIPEVRRGLPFVRSSPGSDDGGARVALRVVEWARKRRASGATDGACRESLDAQPTDSNSIESMDRVAFERWVEYRLDRLGLQPHRPSGPDQGYDLAVRSPRDGRSFVVEVKKLNRQSRLPASTVCALLGAARMADAEGAVLISSSDFTDSARALAARTTPRVVLLTVDDLLRANSGHDVVQGFASPP